MMFSVVSIVHVFTIPGCCFSSTMVAEKLTYGFKLKTTSTVEFIVKEKRSFLKVVSNTYQQPAEVKL